MIKLKIAALPFHKKLWYTGLLARTTQAALGFSVLAMNSQPQVSKPRRLSNWAPHATRLTSAARAALAPH
jgi:hypothetical protein